MTGKRKTSRNAKADVRTSRLQSTASRLAALQRMTVAELRDKYAAVFGEETRSRHKKHLIRRIAWRLQANEEGDLSERARRRAAELAADSDVRMTPPPLKPKTSEGPTKTGSIQASRDDRLPLPGAFLTREYKGQSVEVKVLRGGFLYAGEVYRSLSAVARAVTGTHWNGYHFFKLGKKGAQPDEQ